MFILFWNLNVRFSATFASTAIHKQIEGTKQKNKRCFAFVWAFDSIFFLFRTYQISDRIIQWDNFFSLIAREKKQTINENEEDWRMEHVLTQNKFQGHTFKFDVEDFARAQNVFKLFLLF